MKKLAIILFLCSFFQIEVFSQSKGDDILGEWTTQKQNSRILIFKQNNFYFGRVVWGTGDQKKDEKNPTVELRNRDLIGLTILKDFQFNGTDTWNSGTIYDPKEGKTYSCKITVKDREHLNIRGYIGVSLFGRTEIWTKFK